MRSARRPAFETTHSVGQESGEVLRAQIVDVAGRGQPDRRKKPAEPDRQVVIFVEQAVDQPSHEGIAGADAVDEVDLETRRIVKFAMREQEGSGFGIGRTG